MLIQALYISSLGAPGRVTKNLPAENWQKVHKLEPMYLGKYQYDEKWFVNFDHTINHFSFIVFIYLSLNTFFFLFPAFLFLFFSSYLLFNRYTHCFQTLIDFTCHGRRTRSRQKSGCHVGAPSNRSSKT